MEKYFGINYEFDKDVIHRRIDMQLQEGVPSYICVVDGVILDIANRDIDYLNVINGGMFSICDSSYVPMYIKWIYGKRYSQYCGSEIFRDIVSSKKYRMFFMGASRDVLTGLKENLSLLNEKVSDMTFYELPFLSVEAFDYERIGEMINNDGADIIWVALGAPKQEIFMSKLLPFLNKGVMIAVGAAFKFYSGIGVPRAPEWMVNCHLEFVHRIIKEPKKQLGRCTNIVASLPKLFIRELKNKRNN